MDAIFDNPQARKAIKAGHAQANKELDAKFTNGGPFDEGDPNHPQYGLQLFGYNADEFLRKQYK